MRNLVVTLVTAVALLPRPAAACGGGGVTTNAERVTVADTQRIVLALHDAGQGDARTEIIAQIGVPAADADYAVLIPVPSTPVIDPEPISITDLDALDASSAPTIVFESPLVEDSGGGCACGSSKGGDDDAAGDKGGDASSVSVSAPVNVGPVTVVVLESDDGSALTDWLEENGFSIPSEHEALVERYVAGGYQFIAVRRNDEEPPGNDFDPAGPTSLGLHYTLPGDHRQVSLGFARLGAAPTVAFTVFIAAPTWVYTDTSFTSLDLGALREDLLRRSYSEAVAEAVARHESRAFVIESTLASDAKLPLSAAFRQLLDLRGYGANVITRASTIIAAEALDQDVRFDYAGGKVESSRTITAAAARLPRAREAGVGILALALLARTLRRRTRRAKLA